MKNKTRKHMKKAFREGYLNGVYWTCRVIPFIDDDIREKIVMWFEDMRTDALISRYGGESFEKLVSKHNAE